MRGQWGNYQTKKSHPKVAFETDGAHTALLVLLLGRFSLGRRLCRRCSRLCSDFRVTKVL